MDLAALDVRERLDMLRLPADAERPILLRYDPSLDPILRHRPLRRGATWCACA